MNYQISEYDTPYIINTGGVILNLYPDDTCTGGT